MTKRQFRVDPRIKRELESTGVIWEIERRSKHYLLVIAGRVVATLPADYSAGSSWTQHNVVAAVRRHLRSLMNA
jgi:hypothetical protein